MSAENSDREQEQPACHHDAAESGRDPHADEPVAQPTGPSHSAAGFEQIAEAQELQHRQRGQHGQSARAGTPGRITTRCRRIATRISLRDRRRWGRGRGRDVRAAASALVGQRRRIQPIENGRGDRRCGPRVAGNGGGTAVAVVGRSVGTSAVDTRGRPDRFRATATNARTAHRETGRGLRW